MPLTPTNIREFGIVVGIFRIWWQHGAITIMSAMVFGALRVLLSATIMWLVVAMMPLLMNQTRSPPC